jgi:hypothetical protein
MKTKKRIVVPAMERPLLRFPVPSDEYEESMSALASPSHLDDLKRIRQMRRVGMACVLAD